MIESPALTAKASTAENHLERKVAFYSLIRNLRAAEKLVLFYFAYVTLEAIAFPISLAGRATVAILNSIIGTLLALLARFGRGKAPSNTTPPRAFQGSPWAAPSTARVNGSVARSALSHPPGSALLATIRDWFPAVIILLAYRESGLFSLPDPSHRLDHLFVRWDALLLHNQWVLGTLDWGAPWLQRYLELSYLLCYPLVPLGMGALYVLARKPGLAFERHFDAERAIDQFWTAVLLALFTCYALFPLFPSTPPRVLFQDAPGPAVHPLFRTLNLWILGQYGILTSVFPSGHVAAVTAVSLSVRLHWHRAGVLFLFAAASIAVATIVGRYHYAADAIAGALIGFTAFQISKRIHRL